MKIILIKKIAVVCTLFLAVSITIISCKKDTDGSPGFKAGDLKVSALTPDSASGGTLLTLRGNGLGDIRQIIFDKDSVPAPFYTTLNTETALLFRVPDTAHGGPQNVVFINSAGKSVAVPFKVIALPGVTSVSNYDYSAGDEITLTGNNLDGVTDVTLTGSTDKATVVSSARKSLVIKMPSTDVNRSTLAITNASGVTTTDIEFVNIDKAYKIFTDSYGDGFSDGSWGDGAKISSTEFKTGTKSVGKNYQKGNWHLINFANWWPGVSYDASYKYLTVWIKGASKDYTLYLTGDKRAGGFGNSDQSVPLNIPANTWTYFKLSLADIKLWEKGSPFNQLGFWIKGPDTQDETFYFDDVLLVK